MIANVLQQPGDSVSLPTQHSVDVTIPFDKTVTKKQQDLLVLRYMAGRLTATIDTLVTNADVVMPAIFSLPETNQRTHRLVLFQPLETSLLHAKMAFVGFISSMQAAVPTAVSTEMFNIDQQMLQELTRIPGLFSYSSFELRPGRWFNLVVFQDWDIKNQLRQLSMHQHAAHVLAPQAYEWIRIHNGSVPFGVAGNILTIHSTKYYRPQVVSPHLAMQEVVYAHGA